MRFMGPFARLTTMGLGRRENVISCPFSENQIVVKWNSRFRHLCVDKLASPERDVFAQRRHDGRRCQVSDYARAINI